MIEFDRITDLIEWRVKDTSIEGRLRTRDINSRHSVRIRLAGFPFKDRMLKRLECQAAISLAILKDFYHGRLPDTTNLNAEAGAGGAVPDQSPKKQGAGRSRTRSGGGKSRGKARTSVGLSGDGDGSDD